MINKTFMKLKKQQDLESMRTKVKNAKNNIGYVSQNYKF